MAMSGDLVLAGSAALLGAVLGVSAVTWALFNRGRRYTGLATWLGGIVGGWSIVALFVLGAVVAIRSLA